MKRTKYCGHFSEGDVGKKACACGWVQSKRDMGGVIFIDLVDREGVLQIVFNPENTDADTFALAERVRNQSVLEVSGNLRLRDPETVNPKITTGTVELRVEEATILSAAETLPFVPEEAGNVRDDLRLRYRYLDLRRSELKDNLRLRHRAGVLIHSFMADRGFIEVETPVLGKSTPEGARDFLVPSRVHPGNFFALPQSPQIYKQLLMVSGFDRYYQIARCFRDEDQRADRQLEFTQLDLEMSFVEMDDVLEILEALMKHLARELKGVEIEAAFPRMSWKEAMDKYGSDKPDLRFDLPIIDISDIAEKSDFSIFRQALKSGGVVRAICVPGKADFPRSVIDDLTDFAISEGAKGMAWIAWREDGEIYSILDKYFTEDLMQELLEAVGAKPGDFILFSADRLDIVRHVSGAIRLHLADLLDLRTPGELNFSFVVDFPMFEFSEEEGRYVAQHHPFTMPKLEDLHYLETEPERMESQAYDLVLNGTELGSGSIRIHDRDIQARVFRQLGLSEEDIRDRFGFLLDAFRFGTPPHGGFALGLDRLIMLLANAPSLREVIAFPKLSNASDPLTDAPSTVDRQQLDELHIVLAADVVAGSEIFSGKKDAPAAKTFNLEHLEQLSNIMLTESERVGMQTEIETLIDFADQMADLDTRAAEPTRSMITEHGVFQGEEREPSLSQEDALANAAESEDGAFVVPAAVEQEL
ncbi:MAG: aspartate--tRNA ligase [Clostridiaceae bacterium]|nr:aspartate--tRNA ligase [Clostridiaceae bacterium]